MVKRGLAFFGLTLVVVAASVVIWPGDTDGGLTTGHWIALIGFFLTALFAVVSAVSMVLGVVGSAWEVDDFNPNEYLDDLKESRSSGS